MNPRSNPAGRGIGNGIADTPEEEVIVLFAAVGALGLVAGSIAIFWKSAVTWLLEQDLLLPASADPLVQLPAAGGAGLDLVHLSIAGGVLLAILTGLVSLVVRVIRRRRRAEEIV